MKKICFVLPTKNEEKAIANVIKEIRDAMEKLEHSLVGIVVVDDSKDRTRKIATEEGAVVINGGGRGLGLAMFKGLKFATELKPDIIVSMDSDGQSDIEELEMFLEPVLEDRADMVLGSRFLEKGLVKYKYPFINRTGIRILVKILRSFTRQPLTDSHGGLRAMRVEVAEELEMLGSHTYVQETIIDAAEKGFRVMEVPSVWKKREAGKSRVVRSIPNYILHTLPVLILRSRQYIKWMYTIGMMFMIAAFVYFFYISADAGFKFKTMFDRLPSFLLIVVFVLTGLQLFFFGFILQILKDIKYQLQGFKKKHSSK